VALPEFSAFDRLARALKPADPTDPWGTWRLQAAVSGAGAGGTAMDDEDPFTEGPGGTSFTPVGGYQGGRSVGSGRAAVAAINASGMFIVEVGAGGAGGGAAQLQVRGTANNWLDVGSPSGQIANAVPVIFASGNFPQGFPTVNVGNAVQTTGSVRTTGLGGSIGVLGIGGSIGAVNAGGSVAAIGAGGSMGVGQLGAPWQVTGSVHISNAGDISAGGGGFASVAVYGSPGMPVYVVGSIHVINQAANSGFASVAVYGSPGMPVYNVGTVHISNAGDIGGGTGFASVAVYGSPGMPVYNVGTVHVVNPQVSVHLGNIPTVNLGTGIVGSVHAHNMGGSVGAVNAGGSVFSYVDARGLTTPTTWIVNFAGSGYQALVIGVASNKAKINGYQLIATGTTTITFQSPSGTYLSGSMRLLPGAGVAIPPVSHWPLFQSGTNATLYIHATGTENVGGAMQGFLEA
jgi:hypothetical protein